jgi:S-adenosylmethionine-dependent methyltransferase
MSSDENFDNKAEWFQRRIYGGLKGRLRLDALWDDMLGHIPGINSSAADCATTLSVWDAGGGLGQMSMKLAGQGHKVVLSDISAGMLALAEQEIKGSGLQSIEIRQSAIQSEAAKGHSYDLIVCHAVLEWVADPRATLEALLLCLQPGAYLSLAVYNVNAAILLNVLKGNFNKALSEDHAGHPGSLTPPSPLDPHEVKGWLQQAGLNVSFRAGVRVAFDYLAKDIKASRSDADLMAVESFLREQEAFWALGRYVHFIAVKPG